MEQKNEEQAEKVAAAIAPWIDGEVIARKTFAFNTQIVVTRNENGFSLFRGFAIGEGTGVSADLQDVAVEELVTHLVENGNY